MVGTVTWSWWFSVTTGSSCLTKHWWAMFDHWSWCIRFLASVASRVLVAWRYTISTCTFNLLGDAGIGLPAGFISGGSGGEHPLGLICIPPPWILALGFSPPLERNPEINTGVGITMLPSPLYKELKMHVNDMQIVYVQISCVEFCSL